ncbi:ABC transporter permease subunit [Roseibium polysiphoniae]|uniref:ABC transporter permease subunit n=1 Tax=Roseibium polysiphoniae TaxID=2571221 RepID=A0A944CDM3_9HYPH|nr:ABC transporter permease subunit [Roseibium polysiphoniae]MBS8260637.1 ABC transporter permease subunit [Roseibium polysiphoniae]
MTLSPSQRNAKLSRFLATQAQRQMALQIGFLFGFFALFALLISNLLQNLSSEGVAVGFGFLTNVAGFDVNESLVPYSANDSYLDALIVGTLNTLHLALVCIVLSTTIGVFVGLLQLSDIQVFGTACRLYVEAMRNLPKLLILLAVYVFLVVELPVAREAVSIFDIAYISNRGLNLPSLQISTAAIQTSQTLVLSCAYVAVCCGVWWALKHRLIGALQKFVLPVWVVLVGLAVVSGILTLEVPTFAGFNFKGGTLVSLPFLALTIALSVYHGAQVAEVVRSGISSVAKGQIEAGRALGLSKGQVSWLIILPQAMRVMIPPLTNQYVNILKNTSIGLAVGYSDLVSVMNTSINQTFRPVELMLVSMSVYLLIGIAASMFLNAFNRRVQLKER